LSDLIEAPLSVELAEGETRRVRAGGLDLLVARIRGKYYAVGNTCPHRGCSLFDGWLDDHRITCGCHLSQFDIRDGRVVQGPADRPVEAYEVNVEGNRMSLKIVSRAEQVDIAAKSANR